MGYSEVKCCLCSVSFNIGRTRRPSEPRYMGFTNTGDGIGAPGPGHNLGRLKHSSEIEDKARESKEQTCWLVDRKKHTTAGEWTEEDEVDDGGRDVDDIGDAAFEALKGWEGSESDGEMDFVPGQEEDDEPLDWESDDEDMEDEVDTDRSGDGMEEIVTHDRTDDGPAAQAPQDPWEALAPLIRDAQTYRLHRLYKSWGLLPLDRRVETSSSLLPLDYFKNRKMKPQRGWYIEHVSTSPDCDCKRDCEFNAYDGNLINYEDMIDCNVFQCMAKRLRSWKPEADDLDEERKSWYALTGLGGHMPSTDGGFPEFYPIRHERDSIWAANYVWSSHGDTAMAFHPWCMDLYMKQSRRRFGGVDLNRLGNWWLRDHFKTKDFYGVPEEERPETWKLGEDVRQSSDQWWQHNRGMEYLAANPLHMPKWAAILNQVVVNDSSFDPQASPITANCPDSTDIFSCLPMELKLSLLAYLPSRSIANLRLASRSFRQLPNTLWKHLIREELPWVWELWCDDETYYWAVVAHRDMAWDVLAFEQARKESDVARRDIEVYDTAIEEAYAEENPQFVQAWKAASSKALDEMAPKPERWRDRWRKAPGKLPQARTNYFLLYTLITRHWAELPGLKNRRRIWAEIEQVLNSIDEAGTDDLTVPNIIETPFA